MRLSPKNVSDEFGFKIRWPTHLTPSNKRLSRSSSLFSHTQSSQHSTPLILHSSQLLQLQEINPVFKTLSLGQSKSNSDANSSGDIAGCWSGEPCPPSQLVAGTACCAGWHRHPVSLPAPKHKKMSASLWARNALRLLKHFLLCPKEMVQLFWVLWPIFDSPKKEEMSYLNTPDQLTLELNLEKWKPFSATLLDRLRI